MSNRSSEEKDVEITLDPEDWPALRALGHKMLDDIMDHLETVRDRPIMQPVPDDAKAAFTWPPPPRSPRP